MIDIARWVEDEEEEKTEHASTDAWSSASQLMVRASIQQFELKAMLACWDACADGTLGISSLYANIPYNNLYLPFLLGIALSGKKSLQMSLTSHLKSIGFHREVNAPHTDSRHTLRGVNKVIFSLFTPDPRPDGGTACSFTTFRKGARRRVDTPFQLRSLRETVKCGMYKLLCSNVKTLKSKTIAH